MSVQLPSEPITRKEQYLAKAAGQAVEIPAEPITREEAYLEAIANAGGGGGGTTNYNQLSNKPQIAGTTLQGNKSLSDLGIASATALGNVSNAVTAITNGQTIDSFGDVETALTSKQNALTAGDYISLNNGNIAVNRNLVGDNYDYEIKSTGDYKLTIIKSQGGTVISTNTYNYSYGTSTNIDNNFTIAGGYSSGNTWVYTALKDSTTHSIGYTWTKSVEATFEENEAFPSEDLSGYKLVIKSELDAAISSAYHHAGTKTCVELVAGLLVAANEGNVYNMTDSGTTTSDFIEGAGQPIKAGDNVGVAKISDGVYKFDLLSGFVDTSNFVQKSVTAGLLKNDGTVNDEIEGDVATLKSGLTNLDNEVNGDATVYPYADVITIPDAIPANVADCSVKIEPVQDLHGFDHPWVGGAGKNEIQMTLDNLKTWNTLGTWNDNVYSYNNVTVTVNTDDGGNVTEIIVNTPQASAQTTFKVGTVNNIGQYWLTGCPAGGSQDTYALFINNLWMFDYGAGANVNISATGDNVSILVANGATVSNKTFNPMLCLSSNPEPKVFAPYTNYCPITGHTEASVQRDGKNWFDVGNSINDWIATNMDGAKISSSSISSKVTATISRATGSVKVTNYDTTNWLWMSKELKFQKNTSYKLRNISGIPMKILGFNSLDAYTIGTQIMPTDGVYNSGDYDYWIISFFPNNLQFENAMIVLATETDATFEPYQGKTYTIALGDTIYGDTVDFNTGVMRANYVSKTFDENVVLTVGTSQSSGLRYADIVYSQNDMGAKRVSDNYMICSSYAKIDSSDTPTYGAFRVYSDSVEFLDEDFVDVASAKAKLNGVQLVYELATPTTIQLTPQQIQLLQGTNTLYASTGDISVTVNGVSGSIGSLQTQANNTDEALAELAADIAEQLPTAPTTDGAYVLTVTVADGTPTYSWESAT